MTTQDESITTIARRVVEQCGELADMACNLLQEITEEKRQSGKKVVDVACPTESDQATLHELRQKALSSFYRASHTKSNEMVIFWNKLPFMSLLSNLPVILANCNDPEDLDAFVAEFEDDATPQDFGDGFTRAQEIIDQMENLRIEFPFTKKNAVDWRNFTSLLQSFFNEMRADAKQFLSECSLSR